MPIHQTFLSSNSGEISPYLFYRRDFAKVPDAVERMRNFLPLPFGSASKRPGTEWLVETEDGGENSRAFPFTASDGTNYILHFTQELLTIYRTDGSVAETLDFLAGYTFADDETQEFSLRGMQLHQVNDVAFITHPRFHPLQLVSLSDTSWTIGFIPFERAPMLDENTDRTKTYTVASNPVAAAWASGASYAFGAKVFTNCEWLCVTSHTAGSTNKPGVGATWKSFWRRMFYEAGDAITLLGDDRSEVAWAVEYQSYAALDVVTNIPTYLLANSTWTDGVDYVFWCHTAHTASSGSNLTSISPNWYNAIAWLQEVPPVNTSGAAYFTTSVGSLSGKYCNHGGKVWECILGHAPDSSSALSEPGVGSSWATYWVEVVDFAGDPPTYLPASTYVSGTRVSHEGLVYACNTTHVPSNANRPGVGAQWTLLSGGYTTAFASSPTTPGKYYKISPQRDDSDFQIEWAAISGNNGQYSAWIVVEGAWNFFTFGTWTGTFKLERSINGGKTWDVIRSYQSSADRNVTDSGIEEVPAILKIQWLHGATGSSNPRALLVPESNYVTGFCLMDTYVGAAAMTGFAKTSMLSGNTYQWSEGAFDLERGFPRALTLHGFRLWFAGTVLNPVSIWGSRINDFFDFETTTLDDAGIFRTLAASNHQPIRWLASTRKLFLGTSVGEWVEGSETSDSPITPTNVQFREYHPTGSCPHQPLKVHDGLFFLGRQGGRLYELGASDSGNDTYAAADLSILAEHLTQPGVSNMAFQQTRNPCLWAVTKPGALLSFNYSRIQNISAWAMHTTEDGLFRDVIVFPSDEGDDEIFFIIDRGESSNLERFPQGWQATQEAGTVGNYVDAAGMTGGDFPIVSELRVPPQDMDIEGGGTQGRMKRANEILLNIFQSFGGGISYDGTPVNLNYLTSSAAMDTTLPLKTGWIGVTLGPAHVEDLQFSIVHSDPYPFTIRAVVLRWNLHEP